MKILYLLIIIIVLSCDNNQLHSDKLIFPISIQNELKNSLIKEKFIVYYHSGDCSFCYSTLAAISKEYKELPLVSISSMQNKIWVNYYLEQIQFKGISLFDSDSLFLKNNQKVLITQNLFLIDSQYNIIAGSNILDRNTIRKIRNALQ